MNIFSKIESQKYIDILCADYRRLDSHLKYPRSGSIKQYNEYSFTLDGKYGMKLSRYVRNATSLEKLQAFIDRLDTFFISIEYFQGNIELKRKSGVELTDKFVNDFFIEVMLDSIRSALDIFSMFIAWFYDIKGKETLGFSYEKFIKPLKQINSRLADKLNRIYKSVELKFVKDIRDANKHIGKGQNKVDIESTMNKFKLHIERSKPINLIQLEEMIYKILDMIQNISTFTVDEFCKTNLGYDSTNDLTILFLDDKGTIQKI
ncbi:MAG: hypothetical protein JW866_08760 [Ignavibacteriales bacterium]|nr:hypothetical protein [Ignavibacteriales bacterium]